MTCIRTGAVARFVDDELDARERDEMSAHMTTCNECTAAVAESLAMKRMVRLAANRHAAPPALHAALRRQLRPQPRWQGSWSWVAAAAILLIAIGAAGTFRLSRLSDPLLAELIDQHVIALSSANPVDVISEDRHTVKPWFQGRLPFTFNLPELTGTDFRLIGGKLTYVQQRPAAQLLYQAGRHKVSVFVLQDESSVRASAGASSFNVQSWAADGLRFHMVTDASDVEASRLVTLVKAANGPR
jgi:anti-sigma factor RsiW